MLECLKSGVQGCVTLIPTPMPALTLTPSLLTLTPILLSGGAPHHRATWMRVQRAVSLVPEGLAQGQGQGQ